MILQPGVTVPCHPLDFGHIPWGGVLLQGWLPGFPGTWAVTSSSGSGDFGNTDLGVLSFPSPSLGLVSLGLLSCLQNYIAVIFSILP